MDTTALGEVAAELMERVAEDWPEAELGVVAVVAEVMSDDGTHIVYRCSDERFWIQSGLFAMAKEAVMHGRDHE